MIINENLKQYIENNILPIYDKNDLAHNIDHIYYVIERSFKFASKVENINYNMVYTIASYHDIGHHIDALNHEKISSEILLNDQKLRQFFKEEEISLMAEAVFDHRASKDHTPRSIYGKIVSSADRNTNIDVFLRRTYEYRINKNPNDSLEEIIENSRKHAINKFGKNGYAKEKMYFKDEDYEIFLKEIAILTEDKEAFKVRYIKANNLKVKKR